MKKLILALMLSIPAVALANPGAYIQGQIGFTISTPAIGNSGGIGGGYLWGENAFNYGAEIDVLTYSGEGFQLFGNEKGSGTDVSLLGIVKYTFQSGVVTFAKAGLAISNQTETYNFPHLDHTSQSATAVLPEAALGIGYQFNPHWEVDVTQDNTFGKVMSDGNVLARSSLLLGLTYHFA